MKKFLLIPLAILLVAALIFGGCKPAEEVPEEIRFGLNTALTGLDSGHCIGGAFGWRAAVDDMNALGGVYVEEYGKKLPVRVIITDNQSDFLKSGTLAEDLILNDDIHFLTFAGGPQPMNAPIMMVAERYKVLACGLDGIKEQFFATRQEVSPPWKYTWNISFAVGMPYPPGSFWDKPGYTVADSTAVFLDDIFARTNGIVGVYATDDMDGRGWFGGTMPMAEAAGFTVCGKEQELGIFPSGTTDFTALINDWKDCDPELIMGNAPAVDTGTILRQCREMGFHPKAIWGTKGAFYQRDVEAWGGDLPNGVVTELHWHQTLPPEEHPGIGGTTPMSLYERWVAAGEQYTPTIAFGYGSAQVLFDAIERAGTLETEAVLEAVSETNLKTILTHIVFDKENQFAGIPMMLGQWREVDGPEKWECVLIVVLHYDADIAELLFPIPYD